MKVCVLGVDVGGKQHPSGLVGVVADDHVRPAIDSVGAGHAYSADYRDAAGRLLAPAKPRRTFDIVHVERRQLEEYPALVGYVRGLVLHPSWSRYAVDAPVVAVDSTGLGAPVADMLKAAGVARLRRIVVTGGDATSHVGNTYHVPKNLLVSTLQAKWECNEIRVAPGIEQLESLFSELGGFRTRISPTTGREVFESGPADADDDGVRHHGDLAFAAALAIFWASRMPLSRPTASDWTPVRK